jgi:hypothetical protein
MDIWRYIWRQMEKIVKDVGYMDQLVFWLLHFI